MDCCPEIGLIAESGTKVGNPVVLVKKISHLQLSATLLQRIINESWKFGGQSFFEDGNLYLKIDYWQKFVNEIQFTHFLGSKRQSSIHPDTCTDENFHVAHVFRFAGAVASPTIVHDAPLPSQPLPLEDPLEKQELSSAHKRIDLPIRERPIANLERQEADARNFFVPNNASQQALASEIEKLPRFSTPKAWFFENTYIPVLNLPARIHSVQSANRERERSQVISDVDRLCPILDTTTLKGQITNLTPSDSDFNQSGGDSGTQTCGSGNSQNPPEQQDNCKRSTDSDKPGRGRKRKGNQSSNNSFGSESENVSRKRKSIQCRIYVNEEPNIPPNGSPTYYYPKQCDGKPFNNFHSMVEHLLRVHIRPIQCELCINRFGRNSECKRHMDSCSKKQRVKRADEDPNNVPEYVKDMGKKISRCKDVGELDLELYRNEQKLYDFLDGTDVNKEKANQNVPEYLNSQPSSNTLMASQEMPECNPTSRQSLSTAITPQEVSKDPISPAPTSTAIASQEVLKYPRPQTLLNKVSLEHHTSQRKASNGGSYTAGLDIEESHIQIFHGHINSVLIQGSHNSPDHDFDQEIETILQDVKTMGDINDKAGADRALADRALAEKIEAMIRAEFDPGEDPNRYKALINGLFPNLPEISNDRSASSTRGEEIDWDHFFTPFPDSAIGTNATEFDSISTVDPRTISHDS